MNALNATKRLFKDPTTLVGALIVGSILFVAIFAPLVAPHDPVEQSIIDRLQPASAAHPLGTDRLGRDLLSRVIHAARISLAIGFGAVTFGAVVGTMWGILATLKGGRLESATLFAIDIMMSFPTLIFCLFLLVVLGQGIVSVAIAIGIELSARFARLSRAPTLALRESEFVEASMALGAQTFRLAFKHVLPNIIGPIGVMAVLWSATAIRIEASLSFLGFGVQPPTPTWGNMINEGFAQLTYAPHLALIPGAAIFLAVVGFNLLGDGLRDIFDPKDTQ